MEQVVAATGLASGAGAAWRRREWRDTCAPVILRLMYSCRRRIPGGARSMCARLANRMPREGVGVPLAMAKPRDCGREYDEDGPKISSWRGVAADIADDDRRSRVPALPCGGHVHGRGCGSGCASST